MRKQVYLVPLIILGAFFWILFFSIHQVRVENIEGIYTVVEAQDKQYVVKKYYKKFILYSNEPFEVGDQIYLKAKIKAFRMPSRPYQKEDRKTLRGYNIYGVLDVVTIEKQKSKHTIYTLYAYLERYIETIKEPTKKYVKFFLLNQSFKEESLKEVYQTLNIVYLFSISGIHIYALGAIIRKILFHLDAKEEIQHQTVLVLYALFLFLSKFHYSMVRLFLYQIFKYINHKYTYRMASYTGMQFSFFMTLLLMPFLMYHEGFLISYVVINFIMLTNHMIQKEHFIQAIKRSALIQAILLIFRQSITPLSMISNVFFQPIISYIYFPMTLLVVIYKPLQVVTNDMYYWLEKVSRILDDFVKNYSLSYFDTFVKVIILILLGSYLSSQKWTRKLASIIGMILAMMIPNLISKYSRHELVFLDVGQGDSTIYVEPSCTMVIDSFNYVGEFLLHRGINTIDYLILTHSDLDHIQEAHELIQTFSVKSVILNPYDSYEIAHQQIKYYKRGDQLTCGSAQLEFLGPNKNYESSNENSLVFRMKVKGVNILFTGDIELEAEAELSQYYQEKLKSDILKVAHHGSKTSSSNLFISYVKSKYAVISSGYNNRYGFPHESILNTLQKHGMLIYQTSQHGTIIFDFKKRKFKKVMYGTL